MGLRAQVGKEAAVILWLPAPVSLGRGVSGVQASLQSVVWSHHWATLVWDRSAHGPDSGVWRAPASRARPVNALLFPDPDASEVTTLLPASGHGVSLCLPLCPCCQVGIPRQQRSLGVPWLGAPPPVSTEPGLSQDHRAESASVFPRKDAEREMAKLS